MKHFPFLVIFAILSAAALCAGCGPKEILGPVTGVVTCDGQPVVLLSPYATTTEAA